MRLSILLTLLFLSLPALGVAYFDYTRAQIHRGPEPYEYATAFDVWLAYDRQSFMEFRNQYLGRGAEWENDVKPYLEIKVFPYAIIPSILYLIWLFLAWIFGWGPFRVDTQTSFKAVHSSSRFSRPHEQNKIHDLKYKRK